MPTVLCDRDAICPTIVSCRGALFFFFLLSSRAQGACRVLLDSLGVRTRQRVVLIEIQGYRPAVFLRGVIHGHASSQRNSRYRRVDVLFSQWLKTATTSSKRIPAALVLGRRVSFLLSKIQEKAVLTFSW